MFGEKTLAEISSHSSQIAAGKKFLRPTAIFDEKDLSRITGTAPGISIEFELNRIRKHSIDYPPTIAYTVNDLALYHGSFFHARFKHGVALEKGPLIGLMRASHVSGGVLSQSWLGTRYFGHWLFDDIPLNFAANALGQAVGIHRPTTEQQLRYLDLFNLKIRELPEFGIIDEITIIDDRGHNEYKRQRWELMRHIINSHSQSPPHKGVMLIRGNSGQTRNLTNEQEIANHLRDSGFKIIDPSITRFDDIIKSVANSRIVIGVEGSQLAHGFFGLVEGGAMVILQPPFRFNNAYKDICDAAGIKYGFIVGNSVAGGFRVEKGALDILLERILLN